MSRLPTPPVPTLSYTLPDSGRIVKYRPYLVGDEKLLLFAIENKDPEEIKNAFFKILNETTFNQVDLSTLSLIDLEALFIKTRSSSRGEVIPLYFKCKNVVEKPIFDEEGEITSHQTAECGHVNEINVDLRNLKLVRSEVKDKIIIDKENNIGMKLRIPKSAFIDYFMAKDTGISKPYDLIMGAVIEYVDSIWIDEEVIPAHEIPKEELKAWLEQLTRQQFDQIKKFIENPSYLKLDVKYQCEDCGHTETFEVRRLADFLT